MAEGMYKFEDKRLIRKTGNYEFWSSGRAKVEVTGDIIGGGLGLILSREIFMEDSHTKWTKTEVIYSERIESTALDIWNGETFLLMQYFLDGRILDSKENSIIHHIVWRMLGRSPGFYAAVKNNYPSFIEQYERWHKTGAFPTVSIRLDQSTIRTYFEEVGQRAYIDFDRYTPPGVEQEHLEEMHKVLARTIEYVESRLNRKDDE